MEKARREQPRALRRGTRDMSGGQAGGVEAASGGRIAGGSAAGVG